MSLCVCKQVCMRAQKHSHNRKTESSERCSVHIPEGNYGDKAEASVTYSSNITAKLNSERG